MAQIRLLISHEGFIIITIKYHKLLHDELTPRTEYQCRAYIYKHSINYVHLHVSGLVYCVVMFTSSLGSIFGTFEVGVLERSVSREDFKQKNSLPEWMSCNPEYWETLKYVPTRKLPTSAFSSSSPTQRRDSHKIAPSPSITPLQK